MELTLNRRYRGKEYTIGRLFVNGVPFCDTLEPVDRGLVSTMSDAEIMRIKVHGRTAIPVGRYEIRMDIKSHKFAERSWAKPYKGMLPRLMDVPGFEGVLIHPLNVVSETLGCIGPGENKVKGKVINSVTTFNRLMDQLLPASRRGEKIYIRIVVS